MIASPVASHSRFIGRRQLLSSLKVKVLCLVASVALISAAVAPLRGAAAPAPPLVIGFERFPATNNAGLIEAGELLLGELNCVACHRAERDAAARILAHQGPVLDGVGSRVAADFLSRWLATPETVKPGTTMPNVLAGLSADRRSATVQALTHYLASLRGPARAAPSTTGSAERGRDLFHSIGCVACHAPDPNVRPHATGEGVEIAPAKLPSVPLGELGAKYSAVSLREFLLNPLAVRPSARMPKVPMKAEEAADLAAYLLGDAPKAAAPLKPDQKLVTEGRKQFAAHGCAACHTVKGAPKSTLQAKPLVQLACVGARGCLAETPPAGAPHYPLSAPQREALLAALPQIAAPRKLTPAQQVARRTTALNCLACHARDQRGGPEPGRAAYFSTVDDADLGDEGRLPPTLTGVGGKLQTEAIKKVLNSQGAVRPYMATRMPGFGAQHADAFARAFTAADFKPAPQPLPQTGRNSVGRDLIGTGGLGCINCHGLAGHKSLGVPAVDLAHSPKRLRREWFHAYLRDPAAFRTGTRMPSFWPDAKPMNPKPGAKPDEVVQQIDSLWVYLTELDQGRLPEAMEDKRIYEIKPTNAPVVFRTFMKLAGMHAVAVGYPQHLHAAFDAEQIRWAVAWRGQFLSAESTWEDRAAPPTEPLSKDVLKLTPGVPLAVLADAAANWPKETGGAAGYRLGGYRIDQQGVPTFLYWFGGLEVEDRAEPDSQGKTLHRTLTLHGKGRDVWLRAAVGKQIEAQPDGLWQIDGKQTLRVVSPATGARVLNADGQQELRVPVELDRNNTATIITELTW